MARKQLLRFVACILIVVMSAGCVACSVGAKNDARIVDPDVTATTEAIEIDTEMTEESTSETTKKMVKETKPTEKPTSPSQDESTAKTTSDASGIYTGPEITPPAERVYPITSEDAIAVFDALGLSHMNRTSEYEYIEEKVDAFDPAYTYRFIYYAYTDKDVANQSLEALQVGFSKDKNGRPFKGTCEITEMNGYSILVVSGTTYEGTPVYIIAVCADNVILSGFTNSTADSDTKVIDYCFVALGYM